MTFMMAAFIILLMRFDGGKWPDIIGWFVSMKYWIIVVYPRVWSAKVTNHVVEWAMGIIGNFLMEVMVDSRGNHLSQSRTWLLVFLEF
jgi:L-lactate permease